MAILVDPTLTPVINMLVAIAGMPLGLYHNILGAILGLLALYAPPHHGLRSHRSLPRSGASGGVLVLMDDSSA